jgi:hypothetical protein
VLTPIASFISAMIGTLFLLGTFAWTRGALANDSTPQIC